MNRFLVRYIGAQDDGLGILLMFFRPSATSGFHNHLGLTPLLAKEWAFDYKKGPAYKPGLRRSKKLNKSVFFF